MFVDFENQKFLFFESSEITEHNKCRLYLHFVTVLSELKKIMCMEG